MLDVWRAACAAAVCASRREARPPSVLVLVVINNNKNKQEPLSGSARPGPLGSLEPGSLTYGRSTSLGPAPHQPTGSARPSARSRSVHALHGLRLVAAAHVPAGPRGGPRSQHAAVPVHAAVLGLARSGSAPSGKRHFVLQAAIYSTFYRRTLRHTGPQHRPSRISSNPLD